MNKNIKRTIAIALAVGAFSAVGPTKDFSIFTTEAHASSSAADELTDLQLETSSGSNLDLYKDSSYDDELSDDPDVGETYYAKTSASKVVLNIDGADEENVRIFKGSTEYEVGDDISISSDTTTELKVRVYEDAYDEGTDYSRSDYNQYKIEVENTDDNTKTYTLNVNKLVGQAGRQGTKMAGIPSQIGNNGIGMQNGNNNESVNKSAKSWKTNGGIWYYLDNNGNKLKGWQQQGGLWYYLDNDGKMKTGWLKDTNGSWYYLQSSGAMAQNTVVDGYKIGANGAWIK